MLSILEKTKNFDNLFAKLNTQTKKSIITLPSQGAGVSYQEVIKPGSLFRKAETVEKNLKAIRIDNYSGLGELMTNIEFCQIPGGTFLMGSPKTQNDREDFETQHSVTISDFYMGKCPVTQGQWRAVMGSNPSNFKGDTMRPVENVSWNDCQEFINKLNEAASKILYRLPTEAEWEFACRACTSTPFNTGYNLTTDQANYDGNYPSTHYSKGDYLSKTTPVGNYPMNAWGLYDMHGNVWEWCLDEYYENYYDACKHQGIAKNPLATGRGCSFRVLRGGSWSSCARYCRSSFRGKLDPSYRHDDTGFRLVFVPEVASVNQPVL